mgnify:CR=1 FL=1
MQWFFNIPVDDLDAVKEVTAAAKLVGIAPEDLVGLSTDEGNVKKALAYQKRLGGQIAVVDKRATPAIQATAKKESA